MPATEQYRYNIKRMHVVFCISVIAFCVATLLMLYKDHDDEWRDYQGTFERIQSLKIEAEMQAAYQAVAGSEDEYRQKKHQLEGERDSLQAELVSSSQQFQELTAEVAELERQYKQQGSDVRFKRADRDVARATYDLGVRDNIPADDLTVLKEKFDSLQAEVAEMELRWERQETELNNKKDALAEVTKGRDEATESLTKFTAEIARLSDSLDAIDPSSEVKRAKHAFMQWPIIDGFNSPRKVEQDWLPNLHVTLGMTSVARFDRCKTCHQGISRFGAGNVAVYPHGEVDSDDPADWVADNQFPHPYSSHPRPDVYLTDVSPHPQAKFGCTICHDGQGSATSFLNAQHGPNDPHQEHEWAHDYGHYHNHFWELPMQPQRLREATCLKCHHEVVELGVNPEFGATAPHVYKGWQLIRKYGCFGCHEINGHDGGERIGPDLRLEPTEEELPKYAADPNMVPGLLRKVGPSLKHIGQKTSEAFIAYWTEEPGRFRPATKMPRFFGLSNLEDHYGAQLSRVELAALARHLIHQSSDVDLDLPAAGYEPNAERGKVLFSERGCLACHSFDDKTFKDATADFGPNLTQTSKKLLAGEAGFNWLYTWIRDPQRHHPRSKMPDLFLDPYTTAEGVVDPAADIAKFLQGDGPQEFPTPEFEPEALKDLVTQYVSGKALTHDQFNEFWESRKYPFAADKIKGDEVALVFDGDGAPDDEQWNDMLLEYLGRRSVARYGCYGCHDINGYGTSRPIGTALQDWGRKDPHRLAPEHIHEFLHHHGQPDGSSTEHFVEQAIEKAATGTFDSKEEEEAGLRTAFFYDSLIHHGRPGFIFQKLRDPRSYDYQKIETKGYTERLVMPKFPVTEEEAEAIATFVLGLVAEPPAPEYVYRPDEQASDRNQGEILLQKFNCVGCHMIDMHEMEYAIEDGGLATYSPQPADHAKAVNELIQWRKPVPALTGRTYEIDGESLATVKFAGLPYLLPDPEEAPEDQVWAFDSWEPVHVLSADEVAEREKALSKGERGQVIDLEDVVMPGARLVIPGSHLVSRKPPRGGHFAEWLVEQLIEGRAKGNRYNAWQMSPPPLFREGDKVQTDWLFRFLKDPGQLRHTVVLRMPKFNMSNEEARILANYFAAADGSPYPYQSLPQSEPAYLAAQQTEFAAAHPDRAAVNSYLGESWSTLNEQLCIKCHAVGGKEFKAGNDPNVIRGPNLEYVSQRLRPEWTLMWLYNPRWITPYTSMPAPFPKNQEQFKPLFDGNGTDQTIGVRDALINYYHLMERQSHQPAPQQVSAN
ncbi:c-type cytochrome [bacterium]|nr:c-type cytochrome [bacterium]